MFFRPKNLRRSWEILSLFISAPRFCGDNEPMPLAARFGGRNFHSATGKTGKLRRETRPSLGLPKKKGGEGRAVQSCPITNPYYCLWGWSLVGDVLLVCYYPGAFWNPSKSRTCMIWVVNSGLQSRYSLSVLGAFCVLLYATIVFPWCFGSAYSCIMCIAIIYFLNHTKWQSFKVCYIHWNAHPPSTTRIIIWCL